MFKVKTLECKDCVWLSSLKSNCAFITAKFSSLLITFNTMIIWALHHNDSGSKHNTHSFKTTLLHSPEDRTDVNCVSLYY